MARRRARASFFRAEFYEPDAEKVHAKLNFSVVTIMITETRNMHSSNQNHYGQQAAIICTITAMFIAQGVLFTTDFRPDEYKAIYTIVSNISGGYSPEGELFTRLVLLAFNLSMTAILYALRLIDTKTLVVAIVWPMTIFLYTKIYWEFYVFPFCLIRYDLKLRREACLIGFILLLAYFTRESNLVVIALFRVILFFQKYGFKLGAPVAFAASGLIIDAAISMKIPVPLISGHLVRFGYTRDVANPEYSIFETVAVFLTSFHFFSLHSGAFWIDSAFSVAVIALILSRRSSWERVKTSWPDFAAVSAIVLGFTSITHAFQNARYYYFFLPYVAYLIRPAQVLPLALLGFAHVVIRALAL